MGHGNPWATRTIAQPVALQRTQTIRNDVNSRRTRCGSCVTRVHRHATPRFTFGTAGRATCRCITRRASALTRAEADGRAAQGVGRPPARGARQGPQPAVPHPRQSYPRHRSTRRAAAAVAGDAKAGVAARRSSCAWRRRAARPRSLPIRPSPRRRLSPSSARPTLTGPSPYSYEQKIQVGSHSYELPNLYSDGAGAAAGGGEAVADAGGAADGEGVENSRECVICMTTRDTTVSRAHMCMCSECANVLRMQSEKCRSVGRRSLAAQDSDQPQRRRRGRCDA